MKGFSGPNPALPFGKYMLSTLGSISKQCDSAWVDATLRVVKITHCTQLQFWAQPASPSPMLISVDDFILAYINLRFTLHDCLLKKMVLVWVTKNYVKLPGEKCGNN